MQKKSPLYEAETFPPREWAYVTTIFEVDAWAQGSPE
jgi:hypothetical protein